MAICSRAAGVTRCGGGQCVEGLWLRYFVVLTVLLSVLHFSARERPLCSVSDGECHLDLVPRAWHRALKLSELSECEISSAAHTLGHTWVTANEGIW